MIRFWLKIIFLFLSNALALYAAVYFVPGFIVAGGLIDFAYVVVIFTIISVFIKPIIKLVLSPVIIVTLGLALIFVNAIMLYFLDIISNSVIINGLTPLLYATVIISVVHFIVGFVGKRMI